MGLISTFTNLIKRQKPTTPKTTSDETQPVRSRTTPDYQDYLRIFKVENDRRSVVENCREMYSDDTRAKAFIETLARDTVVGGFTVTVTDAADVKKAQALADELIARLSLFTRLDDWMRLSLRDGDSFLESSVDSAGLIAQVTRKPTLGMRRNSNDFDRFDDPRRAYWYSDEIWATHTVPANAVWFADWQIIHARWNHDEGSRYGTPMLSSGRKAWRRVDEGERDTAIRRKTRAGLKFLHKVLGDKTAVEEYMQRNKDTLDKPFAATQDFFGNADISVVQGDAHLGDIADVLHQLETFAVASPVPLTLIGYGKDINRDILEQKLEQYERVLKSTEAWVTDQIVKPLLELQWLLQGIWTGNIAYEIKWASKKTITPEALKQVAEALGKLQLLGLPDELLLELLARFVPDFDPVRALELIQKGRPDEIDRIDAMAGE